ncbi:2-oxoacid:acceptor oxidoreductase family protein [Anaerotignum sp.]|uniref:2-oxoacid:acceptor oxidoreductase family protein n=1 Tax=Anaerotignum sp. TaxID=2039241 RepID=UPI0028AE9E34|nr:2-oxoacid:acceptor oxidoreductase family protein [Anaerotignum sp.]
MEKCMYYAGVGGQGLQVLGKTIAEVANEKGFYVTYSPKYGSAKRGGLTSCFVTISDEPIGNPRKKKQDILLVMEPKAYQQFRHDVKPGGVIVVNSTLIPETEAPDEGVKMIQTPLHGVCAELGNTKVISSVALGAVVELLTDIFPDKEVFKEFMLRQLSNKPELLELNKKAFQAGNAAIQKSLT